VFNWLIRKLLNQRCPSIANNPGTTKWMTMTPHSLKTPSCSTHQIAAKEIIQDPLRTLETEEMSPFFYRSFTQSVKIIRQRIWSVGARMASHLRSLTDKNLRYTCCLSFSNTVIWTHSFANSICMIFTSGGVLYKILYSTIHCSKETEQIYYARSNGRPILNI
jgi:hypothetical protein